jgi:hypothetical protein
MHDRYRRRCLFVYQFIFFFRNQSQNYRVQRNITPTVFFQCDRRENGRSYRPRTSSAVFCPLESRSVFRDAKIITEIVLRAKYSWGLSIPPFLRRFSRLVIYNCNAVVCTDYNDVP